jgi:hypothetical protein
VWAERSFDTRTPAAVFAPWVRVLVLVRAGVGAAALPVMPLLSLLDERASRLAAKTEGSAVYIPPASEGREVEERLSPPSSTETRACIVDEAGSSGLL